MSRPPQTNQAPPGKAAVQVTSRLQPLPPPSKGQKALLACAVAVEVLWVAALVAMAMH